MVNLKELIGGGMTKLRKFVKSTFVPSITATSPSSADDLPAELETPKFHLKEIGNILDKDLFKVIKSTTHLNL